jgi:hypothetical protein
MALIFEWAATKAHQNLKKHKVPFEEAASCFGDALSLCIDDADHSSGEGRYLLIGVSIMGRLLVVAHTERGGRIRLISARLATRRERKQYEEP